VNTFTQPNSVKMATATGPTPPQLPPAPKGGYFDATQWAVITAILDTVIPSINPASTMANDRIHTQCGVDDDKLAEVAAQVRAKMASPPSPELFKAFLEERPFASPAMMDALRRTLGTVPESSRRTLGGVLTALS